MAPRTFWELVCADLARYRESGAPRSLLRAYFSYPGFKVTFWIRLTALVASWRPWTLPMYVVCRIKLRSLSIKFGTDIPYNTRIGKGLYIGHFGGIVVSHLAAIGDNCNLNHGVTIGAAYGGRYPGTPTIGDRVYCGPGSKVLGGITIGNDVAIGANAVVTRSVPDRAVVGGVPAEVISLRGSGAYVTNVAD